MSKEFFNGIEKAPRRAVMKSLGFDGEEINKPLIAVLSAEAETSVACAAAKDLVQSVRAGIFSAGAIPLVIPCPCISNGLAAGHIGMRYDLPTREMIADWAESSLVSNAFDGAVLLASNDCSAAGLLMGAARINIPSVLLSAGPAPSGSFKGGKADFSTLEEAVFKVKTGEISLDDLSKLETAALPSSGNSGKLGFANSMGCIAEALGMALPGNGTAPATSGERKKLAFATGNRIVGLVSSSLTPKMIMTLSAFKNALSLLISIGASTDGILHIFAIANECGIEPGGKTLNLEVVQKISDTVPTLVALQSRDSDISDLHRDGGISAVLKELAEASLVDLSCNTVSDGTLREVVSRAYSPLKVIHSVSDPVSEKGGIAVLSGSLAENGAIACTSVLNGDVKFVGKAKCFDSEEEAVSGILAGAVGKGDVVVIRYEGPKGGPGMRLMTAPVAAISGMGLGGEVAVISDGRLSCAYNVLTVGHISPEAADGGKIALAKDGDKIEIDVSKNKLGLEINAKETATRAKKMHPRVTQAGGCLLRYSYLVTGADKGAIFKKKF